MHAAAAEAWDACLKADLYNIERVARLMAALSSPVLNGWQGARCYRRSARLSRACRSLTYDCAGTTVLHDFHIDAAA